MKKIFFLLLIIAFKANGQDTTAATITDSNRMYTYKNVYAVITGVQALPPGKKLTPINQDSTKWSTSISMSVYSSKADYKSGKPELFSMYLPTLFTDKFPTQKEIFDRMRSAIK